LIGRYTDGRTLGFMGYPAVNVVALNIDLDQHYPYRG
jgi:potassium-transporting ATPase KdpC subunit